MAETAATIDFEIPKKQDCFRCPSCGRTWLRAPEIGQTKAVSGNKKTVVTRYADAAGWFSCPCSDAMGKSERFRFT